MSEVANDIRIVPFTIDLVPEVFELIAADPAHLNQFNEGIGHKYAKIQTLFDSVARPADQKREQFVIVSDANGPVGSINATAKNLRRQEYTIGYWIGGEHKAQGYTTAAVNSLASLLAERRATRLLYAHTHAGNVASQHVLLRAGFELEHATTKRHYYQKNLHTT